jgi:hypothetical protein
MTPNGPATDLSGDDGSGVIIHLVTWRSTGAQGGDRTTAIATDRALSEEECKVQVAHHHGLAMPCAVTIRSVTRL